MKWKKQLCAAAAVLLALGIALAGVRLNQHFLVLSGGVSRTEIQSPLGDLVRSHLQLVALIVFATLAAAILALYHYKKQPELRYFLLYLAVLFFWGTLVAFFPCRISGAAPAVHAAVFCHHDPGVGPALRSAAGPASARQMGGARLGSLSAAGASPLAHPAVRHADGRHVPLSLPAAFSLPAWVRSRRAAALSLRHHNRVPGVGPAAHSPLFM